MNLGCKHSLRISVRILSTILTLMLAAPGLFAQNNPPAARLRSLNNQLLGIYGRLLSSPAGEAIALRSQGALLIQERAALRDDRDRHRSGLGSRILARFAREAVGGI